MNKTQVIENWDMTQAKPEKEYIEWDDVESGNYFVVTTGNGHESLYYKYNKDRCIQMSYEDGENYHTSWPETSKCLLDNLYNIVRQFRVKKYTY